ncbi:MAG TPA: TIGR03016 family PEP-CTERM system-associated outer membrane protein, partial [Alphaproteobacteria bacterium]|nr:TIGR03016 family PEP-CTERM system-associated outer membrane protein [Alphaproteobacteria bacterium]
LSPSGPYNTRGARRVADSGYQPLSTDSALAALLASSSETPVSNGSADITSPNCPQPAWGPRAWLIVPRLEIDEIITDNVRQSASHRTGDLVSVITPGINITGDTQKLKLNLDYAPAIRRNVWAPDENRIDQNLSFSGTGIFVPDVFSIDSRASVSDESIEGARGTTSSTFIPNSQRTQAIVYSVAPHVQERFGGAAQADFLYQFTQENYSGNTGASAFGAGLSNSIEHDGHFSIGTGDELERLNAQLVTSGTYSDNSGQLLTFSRLSEVLQTKYALSRVYTLIAEGGYERLVFPQSSSISYTGATWNIGGEVHPDPTSYLTLLYGKRDGFLGFNGSARYDITPITSLFASYSDSVETTQSAVAQGLSAEGTLPLNTPVINPNFPLQNDIFHSKALTAGIENSIGLDRYSALLDYEIRDSLLHLQPNDTLLSGYATWNHEFSDQSDTSLTLGYSRETVNRVGTANAGMQYDYSFTESLRGSVRYDFILRTSSVHSDGFLQNAITLSLRQTF